MRDPYQILGVNRTASAEELKAAFRRLAKQFHPDRNPGNEETERRFKEISAAYELVSDAEKRRRYDAGEIDAEGKERHRGPFGGGRGGARAGAGRRPFGFDPGDIFDDFFRAAQDQAGTQAGARRRDHTRGEDLSYELKVEFLEAATGAKKRVTFPDGKTLDVVIPAGSEEGQTLRLKGQGRPGTMGGSAGDAFVKIKVNPHPFFQRKDLDIHVDVPVTLSEAVLGGSILVPTIDGVVSVKVPKGANTGTKLRLKGKGVPDGKAEVRGDQYVTLVVHLPDPPDRELSQFLETWKPRHEYDPRRKAGLV
ncbi:MAG: J domain-containing protein [Thalassobaculales bacterium]